MTVDTFFTLIAVSLSAGAAFALFAVGYSLIYSVLGLMNLAHGDVMMAATYVTLLVWEMTDSALVAVAVGLMTGAVVGVAVDQVAYRPLRFTGDLIAQLVTGLGAAYIIRNIIAATFGPFNRGFPQLLPLTDVHIGRITLPTGSLIAIAVLVLGGVFVHQFLRRSRWGWVVRAVAQDITAARLVGLPVSNILLITYAASGVAAALGGILYSSANMALDLTLGWNATMIAFTAAVLGGLGSLSGAVVGGLVLGFANTFIAYFLPTSYEHAIGFGLLVLVILIRPAADRRELAAPIRA
jgi:branched-chain amino acid transport system permease protein